MSQERVFTTVVVSAEDAVGYIRAGLEVPGVRVNVFSPQTQAEKTRAVSAHVATLLVSCRPPESERNDFIAIARADVCAAFDNQANPAVLVALCTAPGDLGVLQAERLSELALQYTPTLS